VQVVVVVVPEPVLVGRWERCVEEGKDVAYSMSGDAPLLKLLSPQKLYGDGDL